MSSELQKGGVPGQLIELMESDVCYISPSTDPNDSKFTKMKGESGLTPPPGGLELIFALEWALFVVQDMGIATYPPTFRFA